MSPLLTPLAAVLVTTLLTACSTPEQPTLAPCDSQCQAKREILVPAPGAKPEYPIEARRLGQEGKVIIRVWVDANGTTSKAFVKQSSGYTLLDQAALNAVSKMKFSRKAEAKAQWYVVPITFSLKQ